MVVQWDNETLHSQVYSNNIRGLVRNGVLRATSPGFALITTGKRVTRRTWGMSIRPFFLSRDEEGLVALHKETRHYLHNCLGGMKGSLAFTYASYPDILAGVQANYKSTNKPPVPNCELVLLGGEVPD